MIDSGIAAYKRSLWQGHAGVERLTRKVASTPGLHQFKDAIEIDIVRRFIRGRRILDVGVGTGRVSLPLVGDGSQLTGVDASPAMIERCLADPRATNARMVPGEIESLPFAREAFDTVLSVDTFIHFPEWRANLDELLRVTAPGGRVIIDVGSQDHIDAVTDIRKLPLGGGRGVDFGGSEEYLLTLTSADVQAYADERTISLVALVPFGAILGSLVPNLWLTNPESNPPGALDRLLSWLSADPLLYAFAEFIERRIVQLSSPAVSSRMYAIFERTPGIRPSRSPGFSTLGARDDRGSAIWHAELTTHLQHEPNRGFAISLLLAARPARLADDVRAQLPPILRRELEQAERAAHIDDLCEAGRAALRHAASDLNFHGVDLSDVFAGLLENELRTRLESQS